MKNEKILFTWFFDDMKILWLCLFDLYRCTHLKKKTPSGSIPCLQLEPFTLDRTKLARLPDFNGAMQWGSSGEAIGVHDLEESVPQGDLMEKTAENALSH